MTRYLYGGSPADFTLSTAGQIIPNAELTVWDAMASGEQVTDLLDYDSVACTVVTSDSTGLVRFYGPDGTDATLWLDSGTGSRLLVRPVNLPRTDFEIGTVTTGTAGATLTEDGIDGYTLDLVLPSAGANGVNTAAIQDNAVTADKIAADAVGSSEIAANAVGSSELADNAVDTAAIADGAVTSAKIADGTIVSGDVAASTFAAFGTVGNLLTANQAGTSTTDGWAGAVGTLSTSGGALLLTATATTAMSVNNSPKLTGIVAGDAYTAIATVASTSGSRTMKVGIRYFNDADSSLAFTWGAAVASGVATHTAVAPATATKAMMYVQTFTDGSVGDVISVTKPSLHRGAAGTFALPGVPVVGGSHIATNGAVHLSGTGAPEGVITAAPGSTWLQIGNAITVSGNLSWRKISGTGNTGWQPEGALADTGWRDVTVSVVGSNGWTAGKVLMCRIGKAVTLEVLGLTRGSSASGDTILYEGPLGFRQGKTQSFTTSSNGKYAFAYSNGSVYVNSPGTASDALSLRWITLETWPSSLPGSAA